MNDSLARRNRAVRRPAPFVRSGPRDDGGRIWPRRVWGSLTYAGLSLPTLTWVPVLSRGGTDLELSNMVQLIFIVVLPFAFVFSRRALPITLLFGLFISWSLIVLLALSLHGDSGGSGIVQQQLAQALFGWSLALCIANSDVRVDRAALVSLVVFLFALESSAIRAGGSIVLGSLDFVQTLNREYFVYWVLRPALNAFTTQEADPVFLASEINNVANAIVLLACVIFLRSPIAEPGGRRPLAWIVAGLALTLAFVIFSTSAVLIIAVFLLSSLLRSTAKLSPPVRLLAVLMALGLLLAAYQPLRTFLVLNLEEDVSSREARVEQYEYAIGAINSRPFTGVGFSEAGGHVIHNWALFSWTTAGILAFLIVVAAYFVLVSVAILLMRAVPRSIPAILAVTFLFLIRTSVGGAGGIPSGSSVLACSLLTGLLVRHSQALRPRRLRHATAVTTDPSQRLGKQRSA
jgi:hypothetical protein